MATRPGVILNAKAGCARRDPGLEARLARLVTRDRVRATTRSADVPAAFAALQSEGVDALVIVGGDGTLPHTLTPLLARFGADALPAIVPTRGGTVNTVAGSLGARGSPEETLAALVEGARFREHRRAVLRIAADGGEPLFGFLFANGVGARFLEMYYASPMGALGALSVVGRISGSALVAGGLARRVFAPFTAELVVDGRPLPPAAYTAIGAGAVRHVGLGFAPFYTAGDDPEKIHLATTSMSALRLALQLPALRAGSRGREISHFPCARAELRTRERLPWTLDAEFFPAAQRVEIAAGPALRFLSPAAGGG